MSLLKGEKVCCPYFFVLIGALFYLFVYFEILV